MRRVSDVDIFDLQQVHDAECKKRFGLEMAVVQAEGGADGTELSEAALPERRRHLQTEASPLMRQFVDARS